MRVYIFLCFLFVTVYVFGQQTDTSNKVSILFIGDIMGHDTQIEAARLDTLGNYDYEECFQYIKPIIDEVDVAIANLEVTLAGPPHQGYPQFSSPDQLAWACKQSGIDVLATANNHSCDRRQAGIIRTIRVLDSLGIHHTGTFKDAIERELTYPLLMDVKGMRIALLNYTYGTNGIPVTPPSIVNLIDTNLIASDIRKARYARADLILVFFHWGKEYHTTPDSAQIELNRFCVSHGVNYVIGSHPHVIQPMQWMKDTLLQKENLVVYSLGNFVSNQRKRKTDGGLMARLEFERGDDGALLGEVGYYLTWVYRPLVGGKRKFYILPAAAYETDTSFFATNYQFEKMKVFLEDSRSLLDSANIHVDEYIIRDRTWQLADRKNVVTPQTKQPERKEKSGISSKGQF